jgi:hypothetical protein
MSFGNALHKEKAHHLRYTGEIKSRRSGHIRDMTDSYKI